MKKNTVFNILLFIGILLVAGSLVFTVYTGFINGGDAEEIYGEICTLIPKPYGFAIGEGVYSPMPAVEIKGDSFSALLEIPAYGTHLPVRQTWDSNKVYSYPCILSGSIYNGTLIIGGCDSNGQLDFMRDITVSDKVYVTDMTGKRFTLSVSDIIRTKDVSAESLGALDGDLVIFAKNSLSFDYTAVMCKRG